MVKWHIPVVAVVRGYNKLWVLVWDEMLQLGIHTSLQDAWSPAPLSLPPFILPLISPLMTGFQSYLDCKGFLRPQSCLLPTTHWGASVSLWDQLPLALSSHMSFGAVIGWETTWLVLSYLKGWGVPLTSGGRRQFLGTHKTRQNPPEHSMRVPLSSHHCHHC